MNDSKRVLTAGVAALAAGSLVAETWHENYWKKAAIEGPSAPPTDNVPEGGDERGVVVRVSPNANATGNVTAHMVSWPELLAPESLRQSAEVLAEPKRRDLRRDRTFVLPEIVYALI